MFSKVGYLQEIFFHYRNLKVCGASFVDLGSTFSDPCTLLSCKTQPYEPNLDRFPIHSHTINSHLIKFTKCTSRIYTCNFFFLKAQ